MPSQLSFNPLRAFGSNGNPSAGALAYFYETGTSTPLTIYTDDTLVTAHPTPLPANAQGVFPPVFTNGATAVKVNVTTSGGAALAGYPIDPVQLISSTGSAASAVSFAPITGNDATDVQGAIQTLTTLWNAVTAYGKSLIAAEDAATARTTLALKGLATKDILNEDDLASDSATRPPSQNAVRNFINNYGDNSLTGNGYAELPGGLVLQWGSVSVTADSTAAVTWATPFGTAALQALACLGGSFDETADAGCSIYSLTAAGATVKNGTGFAMTVRFFAIGH